MIKRANMSVSYSTNIPISIIKELGWKKGDNLYLETKIIDGKYTIVISNDNGEYVNG